MCSYLYRKWEPAYKAIIRFCSFLWSITDAPHLLSNRKKMHHTSPNKKAFKKQLFPDSNRQRTPLFRFSCNCAQTCKNVDESQENTPASHVLGIFVLKCCYQYCRLVFFNEQIEKYTTVLALAQIQLKFFWSFLLNLFLVKNSRGLLWRWKYPVAISLVKLSHTMTRPINEKWLVLTFMRSRPTLLLEERVEARVLASFDWGKYFLFWVKYKWRWT